MKPQLKALIVKKPIYSPFSNQLIEVCDNCGEAITNTDQVNKKENGALVHKNCKLN